MGLFGSKSSTAPREPPKTVPHVDVEKYMGKWYDIASIPFIFTRGCTKITANYTLNQDSSVKVHNQCERFGFKSEATGTAVVKDKDTNSKFEVSFFPGSAGPYWIVRLAEDYSHAVVSNDKYNYLWILCRTAQMDKDLYQSIIEDLKNDGFPVNKLRVTRH